MDPSGHRRAHLFSAVIKLMLPLLLVFTQFWESCAFSFPFTLGPADATDEVEGRAVVGGGDGDISPSSLSIVPFDLSDEVSTTPVAAWPLEGPARAEPEGITAFTKVLFPLRSSE